MKYILRATSCEDAYLTISNLDSAFLPAIPTEATQELCDIINGHQKVKRQVIELNTIEDIEKLQQWAKNNYEDYTGLIFLPKDKYTDYPVIEIYDDWRE